MDEFTLEIRPPEGHSKEKVLDAVRTFQDMTIDLHTTTDKFKDDLDFGIKVRVEQQKRSDLVFEQCGIEEEDIENSIERLGLTTDPEYLALIE